MENNASDLEKSKKNNRLLAYIKRRKLEHNLFRLDYTPSQTKIMLIMYLVMFIYGAIHTFVCLSKNSFVFDHDSYLYNNLAVVSFLALVFISLGLKIIKDEQRRAFYIEIVGMFFALCTLTWSFQLMIVSFYEAISVNYIPTMIIFSLYVTVMYFRVEQYVVIFLYCCAAAIFVAILEGPERVNQANLINIILFGAVATIGGIVKYNAAINENKAKIETEKLQRSLEKNNEQLSKAIEELQLTTKELEIKNESQFIFTSSMNHELRSPLNGTIGLLQILMEDATLNAEQHDYVEKALSSSETLIHIVNDLLDYSKIEIGRFDIINEPFDFRKLIYDIEGTIRPDVDKKNLIFSSEISSNLPFRIVGDAVRIRQIIINLVSNGVKYTDRGYVKVSYDIDEEGLLRVRVVDSGQGMSEEALKNLFTPFKRFNEKKNKYIQGTGLGLAIVHSIVKGMNGYVEVSSKEGYGSIFTVHIPFEEVADNKEYNSEWLKEEKEIIPDFTNKKFLCVDDTKINLTVFKGLIKKTKASVELAESGAKALEILENKKFDVIFLDHMMPGMDGIETFDAIREKELADANVPIVMLTANAGAEAESLYKQKGFAGYLSKPLIKEDLYSLISKLI